MNFKFKIRLKIQNCSNKFGAIPLFLFVFVNTLTFAQTRNEADKPYLSTSALKDSLSQKLGIKSDSTIITKTDSIKLAKSDLKGEVKYKAKDSIVYDAENKIFLFYNKGNILYDDLELNSDAIEYNIDSSTLVASPTDTAITDSTEKPLFKQADQLFTFSKLQYNFKSQRALVEGAKTQYNDGFIISKQIKRNQDKSIFGLTNIYTTCNLDTPHFGIYAKKIKIIPDLVGISGPAQLVIENIPTPLVLPFGIFPLKKGEHAGFILPKYNFEQRRGFGLTNFGYYIPISEYMNLRLNGDIFSFGSYRANASTTYTKRYAFSGNLNVSYSKNVTERFDDVFYDKSNSFSVNWSHSIDPKLLRGATFNASVNIGSSNNNQFNFNNSLEKYLNNTLSSTITYSKSWKGKPYYLAINASHSQNNTTRRFDIRLPEISFAASGLTPFAKKNIIGKPKWYDKISVNYSANAINTISFFDTAFTMSTLQFNNFNNGIEQKLSTAYNTTILKFFNWNISANYAEFWNTKKQFQYYDIATQEIDTTINNGFFTARSYTASTGLTSNIYGLKTFKSGRLRGIRHHASPTISLNYTPDFADPFYNYYYQTFLDKSFNRRQLYYYEGTPIGRPGTGKSGNISFGLTNNLQVKLKSKSDSSNGGIKKIAIFDNFNFNTSYNIIADSNNWAPLSIGYTTNIANKFRVTGGADFDFYSADTNRNNYNTRSKYLEYAINKKPLRFNGTSMQISTNYGSAKKTSVTKKDTTHNQINKVESEYLNNSVSWTININANFALRNTYIKTSKKDTLTFTGDVNFNGDIGLTENWKLNYRSGYSFTSKGITGSEIGITRNLHCWEMSFAIIPFGFARGYVFSLHPKSSILKDLDIRRQRNFNDNNF
jgi:LptD protein